MKVTRKSHPFDLDRYIVVIELDEEEASFIAEDRFECHWDGFYAELAENVASVMRKIIFSRFPFLR